MEKQWVVSANYLDRSSPNRWLVRRVGEPVEKAVAVRSVKAKGVEFTGSSIEEGFGCSIVAECDSISTDPHILQFERHGFQDETGNRIWAVSSIDLSEAGTITAVF